MFKLIKIKKYIYFSIVFSYLFSVEIKSQDLASLIDDWSSYRSDISSPSVSSFMEVSEIPVNLYRGVPTISIPLYTLQSKGIPHSISLNYDASGIRVGQKASTTGLGWSLVVGGAITRTMKSHPDDGYTLITNMGVVPYHSLIDEAWESANELAGGALDVIDDSHTCEDLDDFIRNKDSLCAGQLGSELDTKPDIFSFSVGGFSGKFILDEAFSSSALTGELQPIEQNNIKITWKKLGGSFSNKNNIVEFEITDESGIKYIFGKVDTIRTQHATQNYAERPTWRMDGLDFLEYLNSWHLTKIELPNSKEEITFNYIIHTNEVKTAASPLKGQMWNNDFPWSTPFTIPNELNFIKSLNSFKTHLIKEIKIKNEAVSEIIYFDYGSENIPYELFRWSNRILNYISIQTGEGFEKQRWDFDYSYFQSKNDSEGNYSPQGPNDPLHDLYLADREAKLVSVQQKYVNGEVSQELPAYKFEYFSGELPANFDVEPFTDFWDLWFNYYESAAVDYWGYYNGNSSENVDFKPTTPRFRMPDYVPFIASHLTTNPALFADRSANENFAKIGTLNKIIYPTGGTQEFDFELHDYSWISEPLVLDNQPNFARRVDGSVTFLSSTIFEYDVETDIDINLQLTIASWWNGNYDVSITANIYSIDSNGFETLYTYARLNKNGINDGGLTYPSTPKNTSTTLPAGKYRLEFVKDFNNTSCSSSCITFLNQMVVNEIPSDDYYYSLPIYTLSDFYNDLQLFKDPETTDYVNYENKVYGGLRVKKITTKTSENDINPIIKTYHYKMMNESTGILSDRSSGVSPKEEDDYLHDYIIYSYDNGIHSFDHQLEKVFNYSFSTSAGNNDTQVGYREVTVKQEHSGDFGQTRTVYLSPLEIPDLYLRVFEIGSYHQSNFAHRNYVHKFKFYRDWARGNVLKSQIYDGQGSMLKETINEYDLSVKTSNDLLVPGFEFAKGKGRQYSCNIGQSSGTVLVNGIQCDAGLSPDILGDYEYKIDFQTIGSIDLTKQTMKNFEGQGLPLITETDYTYANITNHIKLLRKSTNKNTDGTQIQYDVVYAHEQYPSMELENMFSQPYSVQVRNGNDKVLKKHWTLWKDWGTQNHPQWLPCGTWAWDGALDNGIPVPPTSCN